MALNVPRQVAREFGYSHTAITFCLKDNPLMSAAELVDALWQLDNGGMDDTHYDFDIYSNKTTMRKLEEETLHLLFSELCVKCRIKDRTIVSCPCMCYAECETCATDTCHRCKTTVTNKIRVYR